MSALYESISMQREEIAQLLPDRVMREACLRSVPGTATAARDSGPVLQNTTESKGQSRGVFLRDNSIHPKAHLPLGYREFLGPQ